MHAFSSRDVVIFSPISALDTDAMQCISRTHDARGTRSFVNSEFYRNPVHVFCGTYVPVIPSPAMYDDGCIDVLSLLVQRCMHVWMYCHYWCKDACMDGCNVTIGAMMHAWMDVMSLLVQ